MRDEIFPGLTVGAHLAHNLMLIAFKRYHKRLSLLRYIKVLDSMIGARCGSGLILRSAAAFHFYTKRSGA